MPRPNAATRWAGITDRKGRPQLRTTRPAAKLRKGRNDWYRIDNADGGDTDVADVYIYDEIGFFGITADDFVKELQAVTASKIVLHLNTPGGDVFDAIAIYNALQDHPATVETRIDGIAASAGSFIAQAGDRVIMGRNSMMMIHDALGLAIGNAADMREMADLLDKVSENIAGIYADRADGTVDEWREAMRAETWYTAKEAVAAGLADAVKGQEPDEDDPDEPDEDQPDEPDEDQPDEPPAPEDFDLSIFTYAGRSKAPAPVIPSEDDADIDVDQLTKALEGAFA